MPRTVVVSLKFRNGRKIKLENNFGIFSFSANFKIKKLENCFKALQNNVFDPGLKMGIDGERTSVQAKNNG